MGEIKRQEYDREVTSYESFQNSEGQSYGLRVGSRIKFLSDMPTYKVTEIDTTATAPRIVLTRQGENPEYTHYDQKLGYNVTSILALSSPPGLVQFQS